MAMQRHGHFLPYRKVRRQTDMESVRRTCSLFYKAVPGMSMHIFLQAGVSGERKGLDGYVFGYAAGQPEEETGDSE